MVLWCRRSAADGIDLLATDVQVTLNKKDKKTKAQKVLIPPISFVAESGNVTALMGPSGAGKTTVSILGYAARVVLGYY